MKHAKICLTTLLVLMSALFAGCASLKIPITEVSTNAKYYGKEKNTPAILIEKTAALSPDMSRDEVFVSLAMDEKKMNNVNYLPRIELRQKVFGDVHVRSAREGNDLADEVSKLSGVQIPFVFQTRSASLALPFHVQYDDRGDNLILTLIFRDKKLYAAMVSGDRNIQKTLKAIILNPLDGTLASQAINGWMRNALGK